MKRKWGILSILAAVYLFLTVSCASTSVKTVWKDQNYQGGKLKNVFIIGVAKNPTIRRLFEDTFVEQLKARGVDGFVSYRAIPSEGKLDDATVKSKIKGMGVDAVLVTRLVDATKQKVYAQPTYSPRGYYGGRGWYGYYSRTYAAPFPDNYYEYEVASLETNLYETKTEKMIWSGLTETYVEEKNEEVIKSFIKVIIKSLSDSELI